MRASCRSTMALLVLGVLWCAKLSSSGAVSGSNDRTLARRVPRAVAKGDAGSPFRVDDGGSYCPSPFGQGDLVRSHHTGPRGTDPWHTARAVVGVPVPAETSGARRLRSTYRKPAPKCFVDHDWAWEWCPGSLPPQSHQLYKEAMIPTGARLGWDPTSKVGVYAAYRLERYRSQLSPFDSVPVMGLTPALIADVMRVATVSDVLPALTTPMKLHFELLVQASCGAPPEASGGQLVGSLGTADGAVVDAGAGSSVEGVRGVPQPLGAVQQLHVYFKVGDEGHEESVLAESVSCVPFARRVCGHARPTPSPGPQRRDTHAVPLQARGRPSAGVLPRATDSNAAAGLGGAGDRV